MRATAIARRRCVRGWRGFGLVELMIALAIGLALTIGAVAIYLECQRTVRTLAATARLQEVARLAFDVLESDLRMAGYWGLHSRAELIANRAAPLADLPPPFTGAQGTRIDHCGGPLSRWAIDLERPVDGSSNSYALGCSAYDDAASDSADTLVVRRAEAAPPTALQPDRIYVHASRTEGVLFVPAATCTNPREAACVPADLPPPTARSHALVVRAYYVATRSTLQAGLPALRRKSFGNVNSATVAGAVTDEEVVPGVEDLQVAFGLDVDGDGNADQTMHPGSVPMGAAVISATVWLRIRAEEPEAGHVDDRAYQYADIATPDVPADGYRRIVVSKTIQLRNAVR